MRISPTSPAVPSTTARELANTFTCLKGLGITDRVIYNQILRQTLENHPEYWGVWSVWKPNALDGRDRDYANQTGHDASGRYVPLWNRSNSGYHLEPNVGYDMPGLGDYFLVPLNQRQEVIFDPYEYCPQDGLPRVIVSQAAPIFFQGDCVGVAGFDVVVKGRLPVPMGNRLRYSGADLLSIGQQSLTPREREVLTWLTQGKSNGEIGLILKISAHTVKHHVEKIFSKLGVENRQTAMLCALQPYIREGHPDPLISALTAA